VETHSVLLLIQLHCCQHSFTAAFMHVVVLTHTMHYQNAGVCPWRRMQLLSRGCCQCCHTEIPMLITPA